MVQGSILYTTLPTLPTLGFGALDSIFKTFLSVLKTRKKIQRRRPEDFWRCRSVGSVGWWVFYELSECDPSLRLIFVLHWRFWLDRCIESCLCTMSWTYQSPGARSSPLVALRLMCVSTRPMTRYNLILVTIIHIATKYPGRVDTVFDLCNCFVAYM